MNTSMQANAVTLAQKASEARSAIDALQLSQAALNLANAAKITDELVAPQVSAADVKAIANRFLGWKLPENFTPDAGISFKPDFNEGTDWPGKHKPCGTNLLSGSQAEEMVRFILEKPAAAMPPADAD